MTSFTTYAESFVDALGLEFEPGDAITDCSNFSATGGGMFYDDSEASFKMCRDNVLGDFVGSGDLVSDHFFYLASSFSSDGTECSDRSEKNLNGVGSPRTWTVACPMTTSETDGYVYGGGNQLPTNVDIASDFTFDLTAILVTDSGAGTWHGQIEIQCTAEGELFDTTWDATANLDLTPVVGDVVSDKITDTSASVDAATCAAGETLYWRWKSCDTDATPSTGCTSSAGFENDMELLEMALNYTKTAGD
jgi:hypothetical protein